MSHSNGARASLLDRLRQMLGRQPEHSLRESIAELSELCAVPSVSARHEGIDQCAALVARMLERRGFAVEVSPTARRLHQQ